MSERDRCTMYCMAASPEEIVAFAKPALSASVRWQRRKYLPLEGWRPYVRAYVKPYRGVASPGYVCGFPYPGCIVVEIKLDQDWYDAAQRTGVLEVDGYFICRYDAFDDQGRPTAVLALRANARTFSPYGDGDWCYLDIPATIVWDGDEPRLVWEFPDDESAAKAAGVYRLSRYVLGLSGGDG